MHAAKSNPARQLESFFVQYCLFSAFLITPETQKAQRLHREELNDPRTLATG